MLENFKIYRRHDQDCPLAKQGMKSDIKKCKCPLWVHGSENGGRVRKSLKTRSESRALERLVRLQREPAGATALAMPIEKAIELYLADCGNRNLAASSIRNYRSHLSPLEEYFAGAQVRTLTTENIANFRTAHPSGTAAASTRLGLIVLRTFLRFCLDRKWITENPAVKMKLPKPDQTTTLPYTDEEVNRMLDACDRLRCDGANLRTRQRARALILLLLYSGLRISDAVKLERDAVDFKTGQVRLRILKTKTPFYSKLPKEALDAWPPCLSSRPISSGLERPRSKARSTRPARRSTPLAKKPA